MVVEIPIDKIKFFWGEECLDRLDNEYIEKIINTPIIDFPIIIDKNNYIIDGHHRFLAHRKILKNTTIKCVRLAINFEESDIYRRFDCRLKYNAHENPYSLHLEFKSVVNWLITSF